MYCKNCGESVDENAVVCVHCGCALNNNSNSKNKTKQIKKTTTMSKTSIVMGIISIVLAIVALIIFLVQFRYYVFYLVNLTNFYNLLAFIRGVISAIGFALAVMDRKNNKNILNTIGYWINIVVLIITVYQFFIGIIVPLIY